MAKYFFNVYTIYYKNINYQQVFNVVRGHSKLKLGKYMELTTLLNCFHSKLLHVVVYYIIVNVIHHIIYK